MTFHFRSGERMNSKIQFGWRVPDFSVDGSSGPQFRDQIFNYLDAVQGGLTSAWVADHFFPWMGHLPQSLDVLEAWTTLTYLLGRYPSMTLGSIVLSQGYRSPALLAKMAATLQMLSAGRFVLGIGAGWKENEYKAYGYDYPSTGTRIAQLAEAVQVIRAMWSQEEPAFQGKHYTIQGAYCSPRPDPLPPLLIGGGGKQKTLRIVAEQADWWNYPGGSPETYQELLDVLRGHCQAVGRDFDSIRKTWACDCVSVAPTRAEAEQTAQAVPYGSLGGAIIGTPDEAEAHIRRFVDLGVTLFIFRFPDFPKTAGAEYFMREVLPRFV
jgi:alkanesulfonate monooxygenase SsuD/methylene tetrahydromethanopterin reductase-like flavin-dependent oxidoreductase (luciferase family)